MRQETFPSTDDQLARKKKQVVKIEEESLGLTKLHSGHPLFLHI